MPQYPIFKLHIFIATLLLMLALISCTEKTDDSNSNNVAREPINAVVTVNWAENLEKAVNSPGGGYRLHYSKSSPVIINKVWVEVLYDATTGKTPTTADLDVTETGNYYFAVQAFSELIQKSGGRSSSFLSPEFSVTVSK